MQISSFLVELEKLNILTKKNSDTKTPFVLYQLTEDYHKPEEIELELGI